VTERARAGAARPRKIAQWAPVRVEWVDAHGAEDGWTPIDKVIHASIPILTVGLLMYHDEDGVTVALTHDQTESSVCGYIHIPATAVVALRVLK